MPENGGWDLTRHLKGYVWNPVQCFEQKTKYTQHTVLMPLPNFQSSKAQYTRITVFMDHCLLSHKAQKSGAMFRETCVSEMVY